MSQIESGVPNWDDSGQSQQAGEVTRHCRTIAECGFALLSEGVHEDRLAVLDELLQAALARPDSQIIESGGHVSGARNVQDWFPDVHRRFIALGLRSLVLEVLGEEAGLVRVLYFDKPPQKTWALPWHKDMTIAVADNTLTSKLFTHPTTKAGVPHVEAPEFILENMLTLRLHLDDVTHENGPLHVMAGSHRQGKRAFGGGQMVPVLARRGDVLAMRPLISHSSAASSEGVKQHRRVLHFEYAADRSLPDGFNWHSFERLS